MNLLCCICVINQTVIMARNTWLWIAMKICLFLSTHSDLFTWLTPGQCQRVSDMWGHGSLTKIKRESTQQVLHKDVWGVVLRFFRYPHPCRTHACSHAWWSHDLMWACVLHVADSPLVSTLSYKERQQSGSQNCHCVIRKHNQRRIFQRQNTASHRT